MLTAGVVHQSYMAAGNFLPGNFPNAVGFATGEPVGPGIALAVYLDRVHKLLAGERLDGQRLFEIYLPGVTRVVVLRSDADYPLVARCRALQCTS